MGNSWPYSNCSTPPSRHFPHCWERLGCRVKTPFPNLTLESNIHLKTCGLSGSEVDDTMCMLKLKILNRLYSHNMTILGIAAGVSGASSFLGFFVFVFKQSGIVSPTDFAFRANLIRATVREPILPFYEAIVWRDGFIHCQVYFVRKQTWRPGIWTRHIKSFSDPLTTTHSARLKNGVVFFFSLSKQGFSTFLWGRYEL